MKNLIQTQLTADDRAAIDKAINDLETVLKDKLPALTEEERVKYGSINEQNKLLVNKVRDYHENQPELSTPDVDWNEFEDDYQSRVFLESRTQRVDSISYRMRGGKILHDYDNHHASLTDYAYSQYKKGAGEPGFAEKVAELRQFFNRTGKSKESKPDDK